jgi:dihydrofolate reductase
MHVAVVPVLLGSGERLFDHLDGEPPGYECVEFVSSPAVAHVRLSRTPK